MSKLKGILEQRIQALEERQKKELSLLKEDVRGIFSNLSPFEIIKNAISSDESKDGLGTNIINDVIGMTTGFVSKKIMFGSTSNPFKKVIGSLMQFAIARFVANNSERIQAIGEVLIQKLSPAQVISEEEEK
jgi:hypothetical protein